MVDIFERLEKNAGGPIGMYMGYAHGYFAFPIYVNMTTTINLSSFY